MSARRAAFSVVLVAVAAVAYFATATPPTVVVRVALAGGLVAGYAALITALVLLLRD